MGFRHGHRKTTTLVAGLRLTGMVAPMVLDGPINGDWFEAYLDQVLAPTLKPGDLVIMDNLSSHKRLSVKLLIEAAGATLAFLPRRWNGNGCRDCVCQYRRGPFDGCDRLHGRVAAIS